MGKMRDEDFRSLLVKMIIAIQMIQTLHKGNNRRLEREISG